MRLQRALANPRTSGAQIRAIAAELPQVGLEDALAITLGLLDREPDSISRFAARWGARLVQERRLERLLARFDGGQRIVDGDRRGSEVVPQSAGARDFDDRQRLVDR
jgi:hypothetical protein